MTDWTERIDAYVDGIADRLSSIRRHLHMHPEPSGAEEGTARYLADLLRDEGLDTRLVAGGRGVVGEPADQGEGPRVGFRGDIDALRMSDEKNVEYRSTVEGITHACGHDAHATIVIGAAMALRACADELPWPVRWRALLQPAEETSEGAREMVEEGVMEDVASVIALHVDPERQTGRVAFRHGTMTAYCDEVDVVISGAGGHAARPHHTVDPILAACQFVTAVYQFIPRAIDSRHPSVITFGSFHGGASQNVIPEQVKIRGTARTTSHAETSRVEDRLEEIADGIAEASGTEIDIEFKRGPDAVINDDRVTDTCIAAAAALLGEPAIESIDEPSMGGEDFAEFQRKAPGCLMRLGVSQNPDDAYFLHSPRFDLDEAALAIGAKLIARSVVLLARPAEDARGDNG